MRHAPIDQQVIVITGASSGIGLCTALLAAERGARVVLLARSERTLDAIVATIAAEGGSAHAMCVDVSDRAAVEAAAERIVALHGRIDTWVNNAGVAIFGRLDEVAPEDHRQLFEINFWGVVHGSLAALPALRASGGVLVNVGSEVSDAVIPLQGMYSASKHAVKGFTDALRVEQTRVDDQPISIVLIQPTAVNTPYPQHARNYMDREPKLPSPLIDPHRVAEAILDAAHKGGRETKVGAMAHVDTAMSKFLPRLADRMAAMQASRQQRDEAPRDPGGTLFVGGESGRIHGVDGSGEIVDPT
ncbi:SDR family oxidoreductase [Luteimonas sp. FCS-9]|uniref:SDR family oxidoreductase n=1 Tax=Luteimonas sp. FCS-9 TaxID=1547516 RepID=UPI00063E866B|nr:SDR family oxidoreductase [Luteimonas sp. FCS-9]KLJ01950.1 short-chain dehydrogenase [Luteimonas sp. FCS-9]